jgi:hypothetical protein
MCRTESTDSLFKPFVFWLIARGANRSSSAGLWLLQFADVLVMSADPCEHLRACLRSCVHAHRHVLVIFLHAPVFMRAL